MEINEEEEKKYVEQINNLLTQLETPGTNNTQAQYNTSKAVYSSTETTNTALQYRKVLSDTLQR